jgi:hypothetical protein
MTDQIRYTPRIGDLLTMHRNAGEVYTSRATALTEEKTPWKFFAVEAWMKRGWRLVSVERDGEVIDLTKAVLE